MDLSFKISSRMSCDVLPDLFVRDDNSTHIAQFMLRVHFDTLQDVLAQQKEYALKSGVINYD